MKKFLLSAMAFGPLMALAQGLPSNNAPSLTNVGQLLTAIKGLVNTALPIVIGLALLGFFWGLMKFIFAAGDEEKKAEGKNIMIYGIVALFVMVAVWGLVGFIAGALGIGTGGSAPVPTFQQS